MLLFLLLLSVGTYFLRLFLVSFFSLNFCWKIYVAFSIVLYFYAVPLIILNLWFKVHLKVCELTESKTLLETFWKMCLVIRIIHGRQNVFKTKPQMKLITYSYTIRFMQIYAKSCSWRFVFPFESERIFGAIFLVFRISKKKPKTEISFSKINGFLYYFGVCDES